mmetsp:Transcript_36346/g.46276  ORF Transcript_36346/g.46276 Transcript_36346/m.46276 type:complete len:121 (-) Transcript_36346:538-900(-)
MKFMASRELKMSSVNWVQYLIKLLAPVAERSIRKPLVQSPTHENMGKNGSAFNSQNWYSAVVNTKVSPVGPMKVIGWPQRREYAIPPQPVANKTSTTPSVPPVSVALIPPKATAGAKQAK